MKPGYLNLMIMIRINARWAIVLTALGTAAIRMEIDTKVSMTMGIRRIKELPTEMMGQFILAIGIEATTMEMVLSRNLTPSCSAK